MRNPGQTRDRLLDSAERLFFSEGIAVTGVDRVAADAQVSVVTLYKHFGSKDGLLAGVLDRRQHAWVDHWDSAIAAAESPQEKLLAIFDAMNSFRASTGPTQWCCFLATASERPAPEAGADDAVFELIRKDTALVTDRLAALAEAAGCRNAAGVSSGLLLLYNGVLSSYLRGTPADPAGEARLMAKLVVLADAAE